MADSGTGTAVGPGMQMGTGIGVAAGTGVDKAKSLLDQAVVLHERHMQGKEPVNPDSQMKLMNLIKDARTALNDVVTPTGAAPVTGGKAAAASPAASGGSRPLGTL